MQSGRSGGGFGRGGRRGLGGGFGPSGECVCSSCGYSEAHQRGIPCQSKKCPKCGANLIRR